MASVEMDTDVDITSEASAFDFPFNYNDVSEFNTLDIEAERDRYSKSISEKLDKAKLERVKMSLKNDILAAIEPQTKSDEKPQFSAAELSVMAVLCSGKDFITDGDISDWVVKTFPYYMRLALDSFYLRSELRFRPEMCHNAEPHDLYQERHKLHGLYHVPLISDHPLFWRCKYKSFYVYPREGRVFLRGVLEPERRGAFRFLDLPPEIRITIYEYVFTYPASGFGFHGFDRKYKPYSRGRLLVQQGEKSGNGEATTQKWSRLLRYQELNRHYEVRSLYLRAEPMNEILSLLNVNKQIYDEAMPYFYRCNHFHVDDLYQLSRLLGSCGAKRREHFTSISFWYGPVKGKVVAAKCFRLLADVKNLRFLQIETNDEESGGLKAPAINTLRKVRAQKVEFMGDCPEISEHLREEMQKPKEIEEGVTTSKKRKRLTKAAPKSKAKVEESDDEKEKPKKKAKKAKVTDTRIGPWVVLSGVKPKKKAKKARVTNTTLG